jgi:hypothetical protein
MRKAAVVSLLLVAAGSTACAHRATAPMALPEVTIVQTSGVGLAARHVTGPIAVRYAVRIRNVAAQPITLKRIQAQSVGAGAYTLASTSKPFNVTIAPESHQDVELWASAFIEDATITGANGPVTLRLILYLDSPLGPFENVVVQQVNDRLTGEIPQ